MLTFNKIKPIRFGDIVATPILNAEARLRVKSAKVSGNGAEAREALASVFPEEQRQEIISFMEENMSENELAVLQAYLVSGELGISRLEAATNTAIEKQIERKLHGE